MKMEKMVKTAKILDAVCKVLKWLIILCGAVSMATLGVITWMNAAGYITEQNISSVAIGLLTLQLADGTSMNMNALLIYTWIMMIAVIVILAIVCYAIGVIRKILSPMKEGNPFHPTVGNGIRKLAFSMLAIGILTNLLKVVETFSVLLVFNLNELLKNTQIQHITVGYHIDLGPIVVFFLLLLLSYIFQYGQELQQLSDETL